jgi:hypothetical protein
VGDRRRLNKLAVPNPFRVASHSNSTQNHGGILFICEIWTFDRKKYMRQSNTIEVVAEIPTNVFNNYILLY